MYPKKGVLLEGSDADIVILDPERTKVVSAKTQVSKCDYAPLEGMELKGTVDEVYLRGQKVAEDGRVILENQGQYVKRGLPEYFL
jgi:dihydropyrimidinase